MPATIFFNDMSVTITPPGGHFEPVPLTLGPNQQANDVRLLFVSGSGTSSDTTLMVPMSPDPPTGFTAAYVLDLDNETRGTYYRTLVSGDTDTSVAFPKPPGWRDYMYTLATARGVDPANAPTAGALTTTHTVGATTVDVSSVTVPAAGVMVFVVWNTADPEGGWPSWPTSMNVPTGWKPLVSTDKSGETYYKYDTNPAVIVVGKEYLGSGTTGTVSIPVGDGAPATAGMWLFLRKAPDSSATGSAITETDSFSAPSSSAGTNPVSVGAPITETDSVGTAFNPLTGYWISDPIALSGSPVAGSRVQWVNSPATATISPVGTLYESRGNGVVTLGVTTFNVGDVLMLTTAVGSTTIAATGVSGGNAINWQRVCAPVNDATTVVNVDMWMGTVNAVGSATITVAYSASVTVLPCYYDAQGFTTDVRSTWSVDQTGGADHATSLTLLYPSLVPTGTGELYYGLAWSQQTSSVVGTTPGFSWARDSIGRLATWNTNVSATVAPTASQTTTGPYVSSAVLLKATPVAPAVPPTVLVETSINNGLSWDTATNYGPVPRLREGDTTTRTVLARVTYSRASALDGIPKVKSLKVRIGCTTSSDELIPTFYGPVDKAKTKITPGSSGGTGGASSGPGSVGRGGGLVGGGAVVKVHATDPSRLIQLAEWEQVYTGPTGVTYDQLGKAMVLDRRPNQTLFNQFSSDHTVDDSLLVWGLGDGANPWQNIRGVYTSIGSECFYDVIGSFDSRPVPDPRRGSVVWNFDHTVRPVIIGLESELDTSQIVNGWVIKGESTTSKNPVNAYAFNTDPASKYNIYPPPIGIGKRIKRKTFPLAKTVQQCQDIADGSLNNSLGLANTVTIGIVAHPGIALGDIARINSPETGVTGRFLIQGYQLMDSVVDQMQLTCFRQTDNP